MDETSEDELEEDEVEVEREEGEELNLLQPEEAGPSTAPTGATFKD